MISPHTAQLCLVRSTYLLLLVVGAVPTVASADSFNGFAKQPNVILIVCDDLNDYVEGFDGHPQSHTPNLARLSRTGVSFKQAHCNIPICGPSRASFFTGIYPHHSGCFGFTKWDRYEVLKNSRTMMDHFRANGYQTLGTGKLMHQMVPMEWDEYGNVADYGPFARNGTERVAHPDVPAPYRNIGPVDGSFGPLVDLSDRKFADGNSYAWETGNWQNKRELRINTDDDRDPTADELNGRWAVEKLTAFAKQPNDKPFFMGVGFIRPHTPLIVPERFFKKFPLDSIAIPVIKAGDADDTYGRTVRGNPNELEEPGSGRTKDMGSRLYNSLVASYDSRDEALKRFIQAYLASVASVDELIGSILDVVDNSSLAENTIIIVTSDHGWGMGEKDYLYKNSLWQESTRVPLIIRAPGVAKAGGISNQSVSLIDLFPTLIDLCSLVGETRKNEKGHSLDGFSLKPFLANPEAGRWNGPDAALTALYKWRQNYEPSTESYSLRTRDWRYIRYENGKEELYHNATDPYEWTNLVDEFKYESRLDSFRKQLATRIPKPGSPIPPQPAFQPKKPAAKRSQDSEARASNSWKDKYFEQHADADTNRDGILSWTEYRAHRKKSADKQKPF